MHIKITIGPIPGPNNSKRVKELNPKIKININWKRFFNNPSLIADWIIRKFRGIYKNIAVIVPGLKS